MKLRAVLIWLNIQALGGLALLTVVPWLWGIAFPGMPLPLPRMW